MLSTFQQYHLAVVCLSQNEDIQHVPFYETFFSNPQYSRRIFNLLIPVDVKLKQSCFLRTVKTIEMTLDAPTNGRKLR